MFLTVYARVLAAVTASNVLRTADAIYAGKPAAFSDVHSSCPRQCEEI